MLVDLIGTGPKAPMLRLSDRQVQKLQRHAVFPEPPFSPNASLCEMGSNSHGGGSCQEGSIMSTPRLLPHARKISRGISAFAFLGYSANKGKCRQRRASHGDAHGNRNLLDGKELFPTLPATPTISCHSSVYDTRVADAGHVLMMGGRVMGSDAIANKYRGVEWDAAHGSLSSGGIRSSGGRGGGGEQVVVVDDEATQHEHPPLLDLPQAAVYDAQTFTSDLSSDWCQCPQIVRV